MKIALSLLLTLFFSQCIFAENELFHKELSNIEQKYSFSDAFRIMELHIEKFPDDYAIKFKIANYLFYGRKGVEVNKPRAREIYISLLQTLGHIQDKTPEYLYIIGISESNATGNTALAFSFLLKSAESGYPIAEAEIAFRYMKGIGVKIDTALASQWAKKATLHNNSFGQAIYGAYLLNIKKRYVDGYNLIKKSANTGNAGGLYMLFYCFYYGKGVEKDEDKALKYLELSSYQGFPDAVSKLQILRNKAND
ncbi:MAG: sel1 repeat family protein [Victivallales bacterium]|nr:sel1 repeat family protein [Victivallales bacterium]